MSSILSSAGLELSWKNALNFGSLDVFNHNLAWHVVLHIICCAQRVKMGLFSRPSLL
jgi:hypothetical protein